MRISQMIAIAVVAWSWTLVAQAQDPSALLAVQQVSRDGTNSTTTVTVKNTGTRGVTAWGMVFSSQQYTQELFYSVGLQSALPGMRVAGLGGLLPGETMDVVLPAGSDSSVKVNAVILDDRTAAGDETETAAMFRYRAAYASEWQRWSLVLSANVTPGGAERSEVLHMLESPANSHDEAATAAGVTAARHAITLLLSQGANPVATVAYLAERGTQLRLHAQQAEASSTDALPASPGGAARIEFASSSGSILRAPGTALICGPDTLTSTSSSPASTTTTDVSFAYIPGVGCTFASSQMATLITLGKTVRPRYTAPVCTEQPDFMIFVSPGSQQVGQGGQVFYSVSVSGLNGFESQVSLSVDNLPPGASAYFSSTAISPGDTSTLAIQTSPSGAQGNFTLIVTGSGGGMTHSASAQLQIIPPPILQVFANGTLLSAGGVAHITVDPTTGNQTMPAITARLVGSGGTSLSGSVSWYGLLRYANSQGTDSYDYSLPTYGFRTQDVSQDWDISNEIRNTALGNSLVGGTLTVQWSYANWQSQSTDFKIGGDNPTVPMTQNYLQTAPTPWFIGNQGTQTNPPWFLLRLVNHESGYRQFNPPTMAPQFSYLPNFGPPHGYGIMQVDHNGNPPPTLAERWDWKNNVQVGEAMLNANGQAAYNIWAQRVAAWQTWNSQNSNAQVPVPGPSNEGACVFDMAQNGTVPAGKLPYSDAIWIKRYNGASPHDYLWWNDTVPGVTPSWAFSINNNQSPPFDYVNLVCNTAP